MYFTLAQTPKLDFQRYVDDIMMMRDTETDKKEKLKLRKIVTEVDNEIQMKKIY